MQIRPSAVAGQFYPGNPLELRKFIEQVLAEANLDMPKSKAPPKALIVPHAGYVYSGPTAAYAYALLQESSIRRVVLFGPSHRVPFYGLALPDAERFRTPLGDVDLDVEAMQTANSLPNVGIYAEGHALEHSLEVQLPFLQVVVGDFSLLPLCIGAVEPEHVATVIDKFWDDEQTLFLISSDLSHYHPYEEARTLDQESIDMMLALNPGISHEQACGATGINALLQVAKQRQVQIRLLDYRNSGDTAGDREHVVGYASMALFEAAGNE